MKVTKYYVNTYGCHCGRWWMAVEPGPLFSGPCPNCGYVSRAVSCKECPPPPEEGAEKELPHTPVFGL